MSTLANEADSWGVAEITLQKRLHHHFLLTINYINELVVI